MIKKRRYRFLLVALIVTPSLFAASWYYARGGRQYFSPDTLETSSQREILVPFTEVPIYRSLRSTHRYELVEYLIEQGYWSPVAQTNPPILVNHWNKQWKDGQADLHRQLAWHADEWIAWTQQHPDVADLLWADVLSLLRSDTDTDTDTGMMHAQRLMHTARIASTHDEYEALVASDLELAAAIDEAK